MRWRRVAGLGAVSIGLAIPLAAFGLPFAARAFVRSIVLLLNGCVWVAMSMSAGMSVWGVLGAIGRSVVEKLSTGAASALLVTLVVVGAAALYVLQRLLGTEGESAR